MMLEKHIGKTSLVITLAMVGAFICFAPIAEAAQMNRTTTLNDEIKAEPSANDLTAPQFAHAIEDLPLMPGLNLIENNDVIFVAPGAGRIAETDAIGAIDIDDVYKFYRRTLPHLGWKFITARSYRRKGEILHIDAHADGKTTSVHFAITPNNLK